MTAIEKFQVVNGHSPAHGSRALFAPFDFAGVTSIGFNFYQELTDGNMDFVQSMFIDNSLNTAEFQIIFDGTRHKIVAQPYSQGIYPVICAQGKLTGVASSGGGVRVPVYFHNVPQPFYTSGPIDGVLVTPTLLNGAIDFEPLVVGDNDIVPASVGASVNLYRMMLSVAGATVVKFWNGPSGDGNPLSGPISLFAGGSITMPVSGVPWWQTTPGKGLIMTSSAAVNAGGMKGYTYS